MRPQTVVIQGAPGLGKSWLAGSIAEVLPPAEVLLLTTKLGEEKSWMYEKHGLTERAEIFHDLEWQPTLGKFRAGAYKRLMERLQALRADESYGAVIVDPGTDVITLLRHHLLSASGVGSPGDLDDTRSYYNQLGDYAQEFMTQVAVLATTLAKRPKWVLIPWHIQPAKEGEYDKVTRSTKESADQAGKGIEFEGEVLPMIEGRYRRKLAADVDLTLYCDIETRLDVTKRRPEQVTRYVVQAAPNKERHAKVRAAPVLKKLLDNNMAAVIGALEEARRG